MIFAVLSLVSFVATVAILVAYALMVKRPGARTERLFNMANALGAPATLAVEVITGAWTIIPLTLAFGVIGAIGWWKQTHTVEAEEDPTPRVEARTRYHRALSEYSTARREYMNAVQEELT